MLKHIIYIFSLLVSLVFSPASIASNENQVEYDTNKDILIVQVTDMYLDNLLQQLSEQVQFKLSLEGDNIHRKVSFSMTGTSLKVIEQLVKPNSVILSQADTKPHKVNNVILLPIGEQSKEAHLRETMRKPPVSTDDAVNTERQKQHERRIQRRLEDKGRRTSDNTGINQQ